MKNVSVKGVLIGGITDMVTSVALGFPFALYVMSRLDLSKTPKSQIGLTVTAAIHENVLLYAGQLVVGLGCSSLGGYVAARLAKRGELLNGALSSFLCLALGVYAVASGTDSNPRWMQVLLFVASPAFAALGGYFRLKQNSYPYRARMRAGSIKGDAE